MAYDTVPFDLADGKVTANAKAFLQIGSVRRVFSKPFLIGW